MKLATVLTSDGRSAPCIADGDSLVDIQSLHQSTHGRIDPTWHSVLSIVSDWENNHRRIQALAGSWDKSSHIFSLEDTGHTMLPPVPEISSIRDCMSYEQHLVQCMRTVAGWRLPPLKWLDAAARMVRANGIFSVPQIWYERPVYYKGNPRSVVGHDCPVRWPAITEKLDFELELAIVICQEGRNIAPQEAEQYIGGYTIFNDFSARDVQLSEMAGKLGPAKGKDFDDGNAMGPVLVTRDQLDDPYSLDVQVRVNGNVWNSTTTAWYPPFVRRNDFVYLARRDTLPRRYDRFRYDPRMLRTGTGSLDSTW